MAVTQPQVCTHFLKFRPTIPTNADRRQPSRYRGRGRLLNCLYGLSMQPSEFGMISKANIGRLGVVRVQAMGADAGVDLHEDYVADDYYSVLGVLPDAAPQELKKAYYNCMKVCHPDLSGNDIETTNFCMFVNEVYEILSDPVQRMVYDEIHGYSLRTINPFLDGSQPRDHAFVDEFSCIGCKNCANIASDVFSIEEDFGRARVVCQTGNRDSVQQAIDSCPVDCIHWVSAAQLSLLEDEMRRVERVNVGLMLSSMGCMSPDVFSQASSRWEKRQAGTLGRAKIRTAKEKKNSKAQSYWEGLWGVNTQGNYHSADDDKDGAKASRAAAAARRWREYSRKGVDRRPTCSLPGKNLLMEQKEVQNVQG